MTTATIVDTRGLTIDNDIVLIDGKGWRVPPIAQGGWAVWCPDHQVFLRADSRDEARKGRETLSWCSGCITDAERLKGEKNVGVDLSTLSNAHSFECDCYEPWKLIRLNFEYAQRLPVSGIHPETCRTRCSQRDQVCKDDHSCTVCSGRWVPRCAGCGATPTFIKHWAIPSGERYGAPTDCACGFHPWVGGVYSQAALEIHLGEHKKEAI